MKRSYIIWSIIIVITGAAGITFVYLEGFLREKQARVYRQKYEEKGYDNLELYYNWLQLSREQRASKSWGDSDFSNEQTRQQLQTEQQERLMGDIDLLARNVIKADASADALYGQNWRSKLKEYRKKLKLIDTIEMLSMGAILAGSFLLVVMPLKPTNNNDRSNKNRNVQGSRNNYKNRNNQFVQNSDEQLDSVLGTFLPRRRQGQFAGSGLSQRYTGSLEKNTEDDNQKQEDHNESTSSVDENTISFAPRSKSQSKEHNDPSYNIEIPAESEPAKTDSEQPPAAAATATADGLAEIKEEMSAIREFAAMQQDKVRKLQDGYDWSIIKRLGLRIIRCIDNIEDTVSSDKNHPQILQDIRDELIFALESSGVEQFVPEIGSEFKGQEKCVEALSQKVESKDQNKPGTVAEIVRCGYQYVISDDEVKIVRSAQVRLYA